MVKLEHLKHALLMQNAQIGLSICGTSRDGAYDRANVTITVMGLVWQAWCCGRTVKSMARWANLVPIAR